MIKKIASIVFFVYALLVFCFSLAIVFVGYVLIFWFYNANKAPRVAHGLSRWWAAFLFAAFFIRYKIAGTEFIDKNKVYVFVANHRSTLDIPLYALACKNTFRFLSKAELAKIPLLGYVIKRLYITVNRTDKADRHRSIDAMKNCIDENISVFLCPEGTRNKSENLLGEFKDGAFRLAIATQKPLAVLTVFDTDKYHSPKKFYSLGYGTTHAVWNPPIETLGMTDKDVPVLKQRVADMMTENFKNFNNKKSQS